jgi:metal-sulfur cluster biosynthetic enzyme
VYHVIENVKIVVTMTFIWCVAPGAPKQDVRNVLRVIRAVVKKQIIHTEESVERL